MSHPYQVMTESLIAEDENDEHDAQAFRKLKIGLYEAAIGIAVGKKLYLDNKPAWRICVRLAGDNPGDFGKALAMGMMLTDYIRSESSTAWLAAAGDTK